MEIHVGETFRKRLIVYYILLFISLVSRLYPLHISELDLLWDYDLYHLNGVAVCLVAHGVLQDHSLLFLKAWYV